MNKVKRLGEFHYEVEPSELRQDFWLRMTGPGGEKIDIGVISTSEGVCIDVYHLPDIEGSVAATWFTWNEVAGDPEWEE